MASPLRSIFAALPACALLAGTSPAADDILFRRLSVEDGLSQSAVNCMTQDRDGYIWLGTQDGLNRYDGHEFTVYRHSERDSSTLSENYVTCILEDSAGSLWIGTYNGGVNRFDKSLGKFSHFFHDPAGGAGPGGNIIMDIKEDQSGNLWLASWGAGLDRYDPAHGAWTHFSHDPADPSSLSDNRIRALLVDREGSVWLCTFSGVDQYLPAGRGFRHYRHDPADPGSLSDDIVVSACEDDGGDLWFGTADGRLNRFDRTRSMFVASPAPGQNRRPVTDHEIMAILEDDAGVLWVASRGGGVVRFSGDRGILSTLRHESDDRNSLGGDVAIALFKDRSGTIWVGLDGGGVSNYDPNRFKFLHLRHVRGNTQSLSNPLARGMCEDRNGNLWVGTVNGRIDRVDLQTGRYSHFRTARDRDGRPGSAMVLALLEDHEGNIWAGTDGDGLNCFHPERGRFTAVEQIPDSPGVFGSRNIMALCEARDGSIWIGTLGAGLRRFDRRSGRVRTYQRRGNSPGQLSSNWIYALHEDQNGQLWVGTWGQGITVLDPVRNRFRVYRHDPSNPGSLSHNTVHALHEDGNGVLWIGTMGGGLDRLDGPTDTFEHFTEEDGLPNSVVYGIVADTAQNLWISTNRGISCFNPESRTFRNYGMSDGLQSLEFNQGAYCGGVRGRISFGGINGVNVVEPGRVAGSKPIPPVNVTRVRVFDHEVALPRRAGDAVTVSYDENLLTLEFAVLDYTAPELNTARYMLEGLDRSWVDAGARRYVSYANLKGGEYLFRVQGRNSDGIWNREGAAIRIVVRPPFWETAWFRILGFALVLALGFGFYHSRIARMEKEKAIAAAFSRKLNESQERERKRIAGELHDGIGQNLMTIRNRLATCLLDPAGEKTDAGTLQDIAGAVQQTIEEVRAVSTDLHPHILDRLGLKRAIEAMIRKCGESSGLEIRTSVDDVDGLFPPPAEINIYRIIQEGITNIVKHSHASQCTVEVVHTATQCRITIEDDGCGFTPGDAFPVPTAGGGFGLMNMQERIRLLRGQLQIESSPGQGTTLRFLIPRDQEPPGA